MDITYSKTEQLLLDKIPNMREVSPMELESLASDIDSGRDIWVSMELGRHPTTDNRTYTLHMEYSEPNFDYWGAELYNKGVLGLEPVITPLDRLKAISLTEDTVKILYTFDIAITGISKSNPPQLVTNLTQEYSSYSFSDKGSNIFTTIEEIEDLYDSSYSVREMVENILEALDLP